MGAALRERLELAARSANRSVHQEVIYRLEKSFEADDADTHDAEFVRDLKAHLDPALGSSKRWRWPQLDAEGLARAVRLTEELSKVLKPMTDQAPETGGLSDADQDDQPS